VYDLNDPYPRLGTHLPDVTVITPGVPVAAARWTGPLLRGSARAPCGHRGVTGSDAAFLDRLEEEGVEI
jgi:hypothetical protein